MFPGWVLSASVNGAIVLQHRRVALRISPQLLRTLGRHLDRVEPHDFRIVWSDGAAVSLDYQRPDGSWVQEMLTTAKLRELTLQNRLRRAPRK